MKFKELMEINISFKQNKLYKLILRIIYLKKTYTIIHITKTCNSSTHKEIWLFFQQLYILYIWSCIFINKILILHRKINFKYWCYKWAYMTIILHSWKKKNRIPTLWDKVEFVFVTWKLSWAVESASNPFLIQAQTNILYTGNVVQ